MHNMFFSQFFVFRWKSVGKVFDGNFGWPFILFRLYHFGHGLWQAEVMKSIDQIMEAKVQVHFISMFSHGVENVAAFFFFLFFFSFRKSFISVTMSHRNWFR